MLTPDVKDKVLAFVRKEPRTMNDIAKLLGRSWLTADSYVARLREDTGLLEVKTFRGGTRGALKVVFWSSVEKISHSVFQEKLEQEIMSARRKEDFSAFDIFQHVPDKNKRAIVENAITEDSTNLKEFAEILSSTQKQLLIFSGNLSFVNLKNKKFDMMKILEDLVKRGIIIKIICRIDFAGRENIEKVLSLNFKYGKENIEIRHRDHPVRAFVVDNKIFRIKEIKEPTGKIKELDKKLFIFYTIKDRDWTEWLSRIFWKMFSGSVGVDKRMEELKKLKL